MRHETDSMKLRKLNIGEEYFLSMGEGAGARIERHERCYVVYEVLLYGAGEVYAKSFQIGDEELLLELVYSWS